MKSLLLALACAASCCLVLAPAPAAAKTHVLTGRVVHVSDANIKIEKSGQTLSFIVAPKLTRVLSADGKRAYRWSYVRAGMLVRVVFDQTLLGARHADRVYILAH